MWLQAGGGDWTVGESLEDLLTRLDEAFERRWEHEELIDEING
jgi:predicted RNase H-like HicB family nuclease